MPHEDVSAESEFGMRKQLLDDLRAKVQQQREAITWLEQQRDNWEQAALSHASTIEELRAHAERQQEALAWLEEERGKWQQAATASQELVRELQARVRRLEEFAQRTRTSGPQFG
jgi:chromosome segregation ATPase